MKMRKIIAVLSAVLMLCTLLPMGALVSAAETVVFNWDFEDGNTQLNGGSVVAEGPDGSKCFKWTATGGWSSIYKSVSGVEKNTDYVINIGEQDIVLVKEIGGYEEPEEIEELANSIAQTLSSEFYSKVSIGISSVVLGLKDLARAYKEARIALEVGKVFDTEKNIISYDNLGIGRLIYQLPTTLCEAFLQEVFKKGSLESLDRDTLDTVQRFFEYNLNVSETSRNLFVHRNTLVYRLEKIRKITGLDLRNFDQAITFKVALMVKKYLTNKPTKF